MGQLKRLLAAFTAVVMIAGLMPAMTAFAGDVRVYSDKITRGKTGKNMTLTFTVKNESGRNIEKLAVGFDTSGADIWSEDDSDILYGYAFPFEVTASLPDTERPKDVGSLANEKEKTVSLTGYVRRDLDEGYYKVPVAVFERSGDNLNPLGYEDLRVWISKSTSSDDKDEDKTKTYDFVLGEGQSVPDGVYPGVMNFSLNLRNNSPAAVYNVKASIALDADSTKFPFEINDANYDRMFEKIEKNETVQLPYSFAIRSDTYSGYYPIGMKVSYSDSSTGEELKTFETTFYVRVHNKEKEDQRREFNEHDRVKSRMIVDHFTTIPETIIAGEAFDLVLYMKNASSSVPASNLLFTVESEKVSDSAVFTVASGSSSVAQDALGPGAVTELRLHMTSRPGVDQRSYGLTVKARFDSPEYKNADESITINIPVKQIPRLNTGTVEVMPSAISVGEESNVMFGINNTGKVLLYNVMVRFEADSIQTTDTYVGNIKPGETGNVDCMLTGAAPTADDGKIRMIISYEDENGEVSEEEKELTLIVSEAAPADDMSVGSFEDIPMEEPGFFVKNKTKLIAAALAAAALGAVIIAAVIRRRKRKKEQEALEDDAER